MTHVTMIGRKEVAAAEALAAWQNPREAHPNFSGHRARCQSRLHCDARKMYHLFRIGMTAESIRLKENACKIAANRTHVSVIPPSPMSKQQLSTKLQPQEDHDAAEIIKLQNIAVFFGNQRKTQAHLTTILICNNRFKVCSSWLTPSRQSTNDS
jgi:hypothetical protein